MKSVLKKNTKMNPVLKKKEKPDLNYISKLYFQLKDNVNDKNKTSRTNKNTHRNNYLLSLTNSSKFQERDKFRNTLMNDISYIYKESNQEKENTDITDKIFFNQMKLSEKIKKACFPLQQFNNSIIIPKIKRSKIKLLDDKKNKTKLNKINKEDQDIIIPRIYNYQYVELKGNKNLTSKNKKRVNKNNYFSVQNLTLDNYNFEKNKIKILNDYEMRFKILTMHNKLFKV